MILASSGWWIGGIILIIIWIALAFWPARVAGRKGHSFFLFFIFSLFFFPAALIVAYLVRDRRSPARTESNSRGACGGALAVGGSDSWSGTFGAGDHYSNLLHF